MSSAWLEKQPPDVLLNPPGSGAPGRPAFRPNRKRLIEVLS
jgi:hypothetical protein